MTTIIESKKRNKKIYKLHKEEGLTMKQLGERFGLSITAIHKAIKENE